MTRGVSLLLLLVGWLVAVPALRVSAPPHATAAASERREASAAASGEQLAPQAATREVSRAPFLARLPVPNASAATAPRQVARRQAVGLVDRRAELRRVQLRRRLPRLGADDPPWS